MADSQAALSAAIKRATTAAQEDMNRLDAAVMDELETLYRQAAADIGAQIERQAGGDGKLGLAQLQDLLTQVRGKLAELAQRREALLNDTLPQAAGLGIRPLTADGVLGALGASGQAAAFQVGGAVLGSEAAMRISGEAVAFVRAFVAADGLRLSDRLWRLDRHARDALVNAIELAVIQGHGAAEAAREYLARGAAVPADVMNKLTAANAAELSQTAQAVMTGKGSPLDNALRLFRTELNRAHGEAYIHGALGHPDAAGVRFLLSPAHPGPDICDLYARQNLYGLGPGVYPSREKCPWPAHPNTLSYVEVVFRDEVSAADKAGKEKPLEALARLTPEQRRGVLGKAKNDAYGEGKITQGMIRSPWRAVRRRIGG